MSAKTIDSDMIQIVEIIQDDDSTVYYELADSNGRIFVDGVECFLLKAFSLDDNAAKEAEIFVYSPEGGRLKPQSDKDIAARALNPARGQTEKEKIKTNDGGSIQKPGTDAKPINPIIIPEKKPEILQRHFPPPPPPPPPDPTLQRILRILKICRENAKYVAAVLIGTIVVSSALYFFNKPSPVQPQFSADDVFIPLSLESIVGKPEGQVIDLLMEHGYMPNVNYGQIEDSDKIGTVLSIEEGNLEIQGGSVTILVGEEQEEQDVTEVMVPYVYGLPEKDVRDTFDAEGLVIDVQIESMNVRSMDGKVVRCPDEGLLLQKGSVVTVYIGRYDADADSDSDIAVTVPEVMGLKMSSARSRLEHEGFTVEIETENTDNPEEDNRVVLCYDEGNIVPYGSTVTIYIGVYEQESPQQPPPESSRPSSSSPSPSPQPKKVNVPNVVGKTQSNAESTLRGLGLNVSVSTREINNSGENGIVLSCDKSGQAVNPGSTVKITVGKYVNPKRIVKPHEILAEFEDYATKTLKEAGYDVIRKEEDIGAHSLAGKVVRCDEGALERAGSAVTIYIGVSSEVKVPSVVGMQQSMALERLREKGLVVNIISESTSIENDHGKVLSCDETGMMLTKGDTVTIYVGKYSE